MSEILTLFLFVFGLAIVGFIVFLIIKQIQFVISAIPLYKEMVSNQKVIINSLDKISTEIRNIHIYLINTNPKFDELDNDVKTDIGLKEIKL